MASDNPRTTGELAGRGFRSSQFMSAVGLGDDRG